MVHGKQTCSNCGLLREPSSPSYSYCTACSRARQRKRYKEAAEALGRTVVPRVVSTPEERVEQLYTIRTTAEPNNPDGPQPQPCEACGTPTHKIILSTTYDTTLPPDTQLAQLRRGGTPWAALCEECDTLLLSTNAHTMQRLYKLQLLLAQHRVSRLEVVPDPSGDEFYDLIRQLEQHKAQIKLEATEQNATKSTND